jgi:hypothetical protein
MMAVASGGFGANGTSLIARETKGIGSRKPRQIDFAIVPPIDGPIDCRFEQASVTNA